MNIRIVLAVVLLASASLSVAAPKGHKITPDKARRIATAKYHGTVTKAPHLEHEDGQWQYEVLIKSGKNLLEVNVNADTGKIGSVEKTSAAEEAREAKHEKREKPGKGESDEKGEKGEGG